ncbi:MAG: hypothetical protein HAW66_07250, partial [Shewanella sp.]|nr:hypothetical protein [Shewanella sp.]
VLEPIVRLKLSEAWSDVHSYETVHWEDTVLRDRELIIQCQRRFSLAIDAIQEAVNLPSINMLEENDSPVENI